jgi:hypothetical protein
MKDRWPVTPGRRVVYGLKARHAQGICADLSGRWTEGECYFDEKPRNEHPAGEKSHR